jgi:hypothetical protein
MAASACNLDPAHGTGPGGAEVGAVGAHQDGLAAAGGIEARLTEEVNRLVDALRQSGYRFQAVRKDVPAGREFLKLVAGSLALVSLEISNALALARNDSILLDDGRGYMAQLGLSIEQLVHEFEFGGLRYVGFACTKGSSSDFLDGGQAGSSSADCGERIHGMPGRGRQSCGDESLSRSGARLHTDVEGV